LRRLTLHRVAKQFISLGLPSLSRLSLLGELNTVAFQTRDLTPSRNHGTFFNAQAFRQGPSLALGLI